MSDLNNYNQGASTAPEKPAKSKRGKFVLLFLLVLLVALAIAGCVILSRPKIAVAMSLNAAIDDLSNREEIAPLLNLVDGGSVEYNVDAAKGEIDFVIGTHALLTESMRFARPALMITDEQHRFGVKQRATLAERVRICIFL